MISRLRLFVLIEMMEEVSTWEEWTSDGKGARQAGETSKQVAREEETC